MPKLELKVEIDDNSLLTALARVREKQRELNNAVMTLESVVTGHLGEILPKAGEVKAAKVEEKPRE